MSTDAPEADVPVSPQGVARRRARSSMAVLTGLVTVLALVTALVGLWARSVLFQPGPVADALELALEDPAVTDALAARITDEVLSVVGLDDAVLSLLPTRLDQLTPAITGGVRTYVTDRLERLLADAEVRAVIVEAVERTHAAMLRLIDGDGLIDGLRLADGTVTFNALPLVARGMRIVQELGLLQDVDVPSFDAAGDPDAQRAELAAALDRPVPDDFGEVVVYRGEAAARVDAMLDTAQRLVLLARRALAAVVVLTVAAAAATIWLAPRRGRAAALLTVMIVATLVVVRALTSAVVDRVPTLAVQPGARAAVASVVGSLAAGLITMVTVVAIAGVVFGVIVWLLGESRSRAWLPAGVSTQTAIMVVAAVGAVWTVAAGGATLGPLLVAALVLAIAGAAGLTVRRPARPRTDG